MIKKALQLQIGDLVFFDGDRWVMDGFTRYGTDVWLSPLDGNQLPRLIPMDSESSFSVYAREALDG